MARHTSLTCVVLAPLLACASGQSADAGRRTVKLSIASEERGDAAEPVDPEEETARYVRENYRKREVRIPMRDGAKLFTAIYEPKDTERKHAFLMKRTPYSVRPYGEGEYSRSLGPSNELMRDGYIFVYQDVRGCYMSEGEFVNMTPHQPSKADQRDVDESTDTYDTIAWLLDNIENHNGKVGQWGISYPGFYAAAGMIDAHPALKAVSPQAPIADWYFDDFHHHGAFFLPHAFNFLATFGKKREGLTKERGERFKHGTEDGYRFFQELGPLRNANEKYFKGKIAFWNDIVAHPDYDEFWKERNLLPHLKNVAPAVMTVGGWYDAEDLYGPLQIYRSVERNNPDVFNILVMGPWRHGGWARDDGDRLGNAHFGAPTSVFYRKSIERKFFNHFLRDEGKNDLPEAYVFETGANRWRTFNAWPPSDTRERALYLWSDGRMRFDRPPLDRRGYEEWVSDPAHPVPFTEDVAVRMTREYMTDDQRFAARRNDVVTFATDPLDVPVTLAGPVVAELWVSTSGTASDWIVKLIDVFPGNASDHEALARGKHMAHAQMMVRSEVIRGRYRDGYDKPKPFRPNRPTKIRLPLQDVLHTFKKGHRIMIHVQSSWFPLVDVNPHRYQPNVFLAEDEAFVPATQRVYRSSKYASHLQVGVIANPPQ